MKHAIRNKKAPRLKLSTALFKGSFVHNPVLTQIIGICPIVGAATTLTDGLALSVMLTVILIVTESVTSLLLRKVPRWFRMCIYALIGAGLTLLCDSFIYRLTPDSGAGLGIYFYLLCINALAVIRCEKFACKTSVINSATDGLAAGIGFGAVAVTVGAIREIMNYGTIFAEEGSVPRLSQSAMPFVALVILGFLAAVHKWLLIRFYPEEIRDTFSMNAVHEKPATKDPGLFTDKTKSKPKVIRNYDQIRPRYGADEEKGRDE